MQKYLRLFSLSCIITLTTLSAIAADEQLSVARRVMNAEHPITKVMADEFLSVYAQRGGGFVVMTADEQSPRVLAYSTTTQLQPGSDNPGFNWWLRSIRQALQSKGAHQFKTTKPDPDRFAPRIDSLITTLWGQREPFKFMCPFDTYFPDRSLDGTYQPDMGHFSVGCVGTAMAQYMNYYRFPLRGVGQDSVVVNYPAKDVVYRVDFEEGVYDWDNMIDDYQGDYTTEQGMAVAKLCYHCGVAAQSLYNEYGAGSNDQKCLEAFRKHFNYNDTARYIVRSNYTEPAWMEMVYTELNNGHPILYSGKDINLNEGILAGHNFIIDGYDENGLVHVNWGWYGIENGFFDIALLNPVQYTYDDWQAMYVGLYPNREPLVGDVNADDKVNVSDVTYLINMILGAVPQDMEVADLNHDTKVNVSDVTYLINLILGIL